MKSHLQAAAAEIFSFTRSSITVS